MNVQCLSKKLNKTPTPTEDSISKNIHAQTSALSCKDTHTHARTHARTHTRTHTPDLDYSGQSRSRSRHDDKWSLFPIGHWSPQCPSLDWKIKKHAVTNFYPHFHSLFLRVGCSRHWLFEKQTSSLHISKHCITLQEQPEIIFPLKYPNICFSSKQNHCHGCVRSYHLIQLNIIISS